MAVAWDPPPRDAPVGHVVQWGPAPGTYLASAVVPPGETTYALEGLEPGLRYYVTVVAVDAAGARSLPSNELSIVAGPAGPDVGTDTTDLLPREHLAVAVTGGAGSVAVRPGGRDCAQDCVVTLPRGTQVLIAATPAAGHRLAGFDGCDQEGVGTCVVRLDGTRQVAARFVPDESAVTTHTRYLAEGAAGDFFEARIALANPGGRTTTARLRFLRDDGLAVATDVEVPALASARVDASGVPGLSGHAFSTVVESDVALAVDRTMTWRGRDGRVYGAHAETALVAPAPRWYLAEGATHAGFDLFYLLQNPQDSAVRARITYLRSAGPPLERTLVLPPASRTSIWVDQEAFGAEGRRLLAASEVSAVVETLDGSGIVVERAMYDSRRGVTFEAGHESAGVTAPARRWYFAEGATGTFFDQFLLVANPADTAADLRVTYLLPDGSRVARAHRVGPRSRYTIWVDEEGPELADTAVSTTVEAEVPVVVERSMWWPGTSATWREAHNTAGATAPSVRWAVGDGNGGTAADGGATYFLIANPGGDAATVRVTLLFADGVPPVTRIMTVGAYTRFGLSVGDAFPESRGLACGALVESVGPSPVPIVVERAMYADAPGQPWASGTALLGTPVP